MTANDNDHKRVAAVIEQADQRGGGEWTTKAYALKWANAATVSVALTSVVPDAKVSSDTVNKMLIVTASAKDHAKIQAVLDQADKRGGGGELVTKAYRLQTANPSTIMTAITPVVPNATISSDPTNQMLVVTASEEDHVRIKTIIDEADRRQDGELITEVYALKWANPTALSYSIKPIAPTAVVSPDVYNKTLIVSATAKDHARIKPVIDQADMRGGGDMTTTAYTLKWANASTISTALTSVVPDAKVSSDPVNKMLIVTASKEDHAKIQAVLDQADKRGGGDLATKAYTLRTANPTTIMAALLPVVPDAKISSDLTNQMLIVTASDEDHLRIKTIVDEADRRADGELVTRGLPAEVGESDGAEQFHQTNLAAGHRESRRLQQDAHRDGDRQGPCAHQADCGTGGSPRRRRTGHESVRLQTGQSRHGRHRANHAHAECHDEQ